MWALTAADEPHEFGAIVADEENRGTAEFLVAAQSDISRLLNAIEDAHGLLAWGRGYLSAHALMVGRPGDLQDLLAAITRRTGVQDLKP